ncbi:MAG TPA: hypothetical protein VI248_16270 [Kineosporiaceae bacterium]
MNTGGRSRPRGPLLCGLGWGVLVLTALGLWLGAAAGRSISDGHLAPSVSHAVAMASVAVRPPLPDVDSVPAELAAVAVTFVGVLISTRRELAPARVRFERRQGRAPPGASRIR